MIRVRLFTYIISALESIFSANLLVASAIVHSKPVIGILYLGSIFKLIYIYRERGKGLPPLGAGIVFSPQ